MAKIADEVRRYVDTRPYILEALEKGIANLSELSRRIGKEIGTDKFNAVKAALRRYKMELGKERRTKEKDIMSLISRSSVKVLDSISVIVSSKEIEIRSIAKVGVGPNFVYILESQEPLPRQKDYILKSYSGKSAIIIHSDEHIEKVTGVVAYLSSLLAQLGVNVYEFLSCYTETVIVAEKRDAVRIYSILSGMSM